MKVYSIKPGCAEPIGPKSDVPESNAQESEVHLRRTIGLPLLVPYGLAITNSAGIYVLIGTAASRAGEPAPASLVFAAFFMTFSAATLCSTEFSQYLLSFR